VLLKVGCHETGSLTLSQLCFKNGSQLRNILYFQLQLLFAGSVWPLHAPGMQVYLQESCQLLHLAFSWPFAWPLCLSSAVLKNISEGKPESKAKLTMHGLFDHYTVVTLG
jgi:hypothetical protein